MRAVETRSGETIGPAFRMLIVFGEGANMILRAIMRGTGGADGAAENEQDWGVFFAGVIGFWWRWKFEGWISV